QGHSQAFWHLRLSDELIDRIGDLGEILVQRADVDIGGAPQLVVIHLGGGLDAGDIADHIEACGCEVVWPAQRNGAQIAEGLDLAFEVSAVITLSTTSRWSRPISLARMRSTSSCNAG